MKEQMSELYDKLVISRISNSPAIPDTITVWALLSVPGRRFFSFEVIQIPDRQGGRASGREGVQAEPHPPKSGNGNVPESMGP